MSVWTYGSFSQRYCACCLATWFQLNMGRGIRRVCYYVCQASYRSSSHTHSSVAAHRSSSHTHSSVAAKNTLNYAHVHPLKRQMIKHWSVRSERESLCSLKFFSTPSSTGQRAKEETTRRDLAAQDEDPFDSLTDKIPQKPVTFVEGASYSLIIFFGFAVAGFAAYGVFKELIFEPKEYKVFNKALNRVQSDNQVTVRIGTPITGYGQDTRNRAARQHIPHRTWADEDGVQRIEVQFYVRGPYGVGRVHSEMFKDKVDKQWKFTYLIVDILSPSPTRLMLESYVPA